MLMNNLKLSCLNYMMREKLSIKAISQSNQLMNSQKITDIHQFCNLVQKYKI